MMKKLIFAFFAATILLSSCVSADKIAVLDVSEPQSKSATEFVVVVTVENANGQNIKIKDAKFDLAIDGRVLARVITGQTIVIPRKRTSEIEVPVRVNIRDLVGIIALADNPEKLEEATLTGDVVVKAGMLRKKYDLQNVPLKNVVPMLDSKIKQRR